MTELSVKNLKVQYKTQDKVVHAVDDITFALANNESLGIAGESGCGKSTLGLAIIRSVQGGEIVSGDIVLDGKSLLRLTEKEFAKNILWKEISMVFQGAMNSLDPVFSIRQQFEEILKTHEWDGEYHNKIIRSVERVGLSKSVLERFPHELSGGMKQRVAIAMALLLEPRLVIADEPTTALDVLVQAQILTLLKKLKREGVSYVLISHDLGVISEIVEKVAIMYAGKIVEFGSLEEVYSNPKHPYTQALLQSTPKMKRGPMLVTLEGSPPNLANPPTGCRFYDRCPKAMEKCKMDPHKTDTKSGYVYCWLYENE